MAQSLPSSGTGGGGGKSGRISMLASFAIVIAGLYFARDVLIPLALAIMLSFLLAPLILRLQRWGLGRVPALLIVGESMAMAQSGEGRAVVETPVKEARA